MTSPAHANRSPIEELLTCPVCLDVYTHPRLLNCNHAFCSPCLEQLTTHCTEQHTFLVCPLCKTGTALNRKRGIKGLSPCFWIQQIKDYWTQEQSLTHHCGCGGGNKASVSSSGKECDSCRAALSSNSGWFYCGDCSVFLCEKCNLKHASTTTFAQHVVLDLSDEALREYMMCGRHGDRIGYYLCVACRVALCPLCLLNHDPLHGLAEVREVLKLYFPGGNTRGNSIKLQVSDLWSSLVHIQLKGHYLSNRSGNQSVLSLRL